MEEWLFNILKDSTIIDNQIYQVENGIFNSKRLPQPIYLNRKKSGQWNYPYNDEYAIWHFLNQTNREVQNLFQTNKQKALILFNNKEYEHNSSDNFIEVDGIDCMNFTLKTGNIIGYLKKGEYAIKISSRYGDNFLKYIISDADGFWEIENYGGSDNEQGYEWLLIYLWKTKIKKAFRLGLPKKYKTQQQELTRLRGNLNPVHYFTTGKEIGIYDCKYREHSYNNEATRLIAATFQKIGKHEFLKDCTLIKNAFYTAVEGDKFSTKELYQTKHFSNPFYKDYNEVIDLSKLILRDQLSDFGEWSDTSAFFFDVSMLFEYFVKKIFKREGFLVNSKFENRAEISTGSFTYNRKLEPDIVFSHKGKGFVFDVKYKNFDFVYGVSREDLFQLHTYAGQYGNEMELKACGFIYPISSERWEKNTMDLGTPLIKNKIKILGTEIDFYVLFIVVPDNNIENYYSAFKKNNEIFAELIKLITD
ncbi:McrC family protein [Bacteroidales bacterium OttesenSCG-928-C19]|nr:McrC family protein [Bacteroidales bacterium OttesenSCG-928-C19]